MSLQAYLDECATRYSEEIQMLGTTWQGPGYHTRIANGTWAHPTRESLDYALGLLRSGDKNNKLRAAQIIRSVLLLQDTRPTSPTYGIWPWLYEEPLPQMAPPDWNWADFCGARLVQMLVEHASALPGDLREAMRQSVGHAAWSIFRRNVQPSYTNIAIMGAGVTAAVGELLDEPRLLEYGRQRLANVVAHTDFHGSFNEYNSPTYTVVAVHECERILQLVNDPATRASAESLRQHAWQTIADHFHPATQQWAGPHSRTYGDLLRPSTVAYLAAATGLPLQIHPSAQGKEAESEQTHIRHLPCPESLRQRFQQLPTTPTLIRQRFIRSDEAAKSTWGTTYLTEKTTLGTVNYDSMWTQRRGLIGYLQTDADPAVVLRLRFLHDGQDFASAGVRNRQVGNRVLSAITMLSNKGDFHLHLDRPADGLFVARDFRARYELVGTGVSARQLDGSRYELAAGEHRIVLTMAPRPFGPHPIRWQLGQATDRVYLDAICYEGEEAHFDLTKLGQVVLSAGLELLSTGETASNAPLMEENLPDRRLRIYWPLDAALQVEIPLYADVL